MADLVKGNFCLEGHIDVPPEKRNVIAEALVEHIDQTRAEPGCIYFNVDPCPVRKGRYIVSEAFVDEAAFKKHQERASASNWANVSEGVPRNYKTWQVN